MKIPDMIPCLHRNIFLPITPPQLPTPFHSARIWLHPRWAITVPLAWFATKNTYPQQPEGPYHHHHTHPLISRKDDSRFRVFGNIPLIYSLSTLHSAHTSFTHRGTHGIRRHLRRRRDSRLHLSRNLAQQRSAFRDGNTLMIWICNGQCD